MERLSNPMAFSFILCVMQGPPIWGTTHRERYVDIAEEVEKATSEIRTLNLADDSFVENS